MRRRIADIAQKTRFQRICLEGAESEYRSALLRKENIFKAAFRLYP